MIDLVADALLLCGSLGAALYCALLSRKVGKLNQYETGLGGAIAVLSSQIDEIQKALDETQLAASRSGDELKKLIEEAHEIAGKLDVMLVGLDDLPDTSGVLIKAQDPNLNTPEEVAFVHLGRNSRSTA